MWFDLTLHDTRSLIMTLSEFPTPLQKYLLAALPESHQKLFIDQLELRKMSLGKILYGSGDEELYVYFSTDSIINSNYLVIT